MTEAGTPYTGRFAPSPTGPLHAGSLVAALASWLDARAHGGRWLLRIEDIDSPRCIRGAARLIVQALATCGLVPDEAPIYQSQRGKLYQAALDRLIDGGWAYPCGCTRHDIAQALAAAGHPHQRHGELVYPGTCRQGLHGKSPRAWRFNVEKFREIVGTSQSKTPLSTVESIAPALHGAQVPWHDRLLGSQWQDVSCAVGDFVLKRADDFWAYQLAVVVDDAAQGVTDIVRGEDLADNSARQILLQRALGLPTPRYLHTPLVRGTDGDKLSKQNGAQALDLQDPLAALRLAGTVLGLKQGLDASTQDAWLGQAVRQWACRLKLAGD